MKSIIQKLFFTLIFTIILFGCGKNEPGNDAPSSALPNPSNAPTDTIKVKGLFIGMNINHASSAMKKIISDQNLDKYEVIDARKVNEDSCVLIVVKDLKNIIGGQGVDESRFNEILDRECSGQLNLLNQYAALAVLAGADGKVNRIYFNDLTDLFNAKGLPVSDFLQNFLNAYSIPEMKANENENAASWTYVSPDGSKVEVVAVKMMGKSILVRIQLEKVAGIEDIKQGFN